MVDNGSVVGSVGGVGLGVAVALGGGAGCINKEQRENTLILNFEHGDKIHRCTFIE